MKRRIARKIDNYKVMPQRLINKAMYLYLRIREHWSLSIRGKNYSTCYVMDKWGRVLIYSRSYPGGASNTDSATMRGTMNSAGCTQSVTLNAKERQEDDQQKHFHQMWSMFETSW
jgi:hypothetical protein